MSKWQLEGYEGDDLYAELERRSGESTLYHGDQVFKFGLREFDGSIDRRMAEARILRLYPLERPEDWIRSDPARLIDDESAGSEVATIINRERRKAAILELLKQVHESLHPEQIPEEVADMMHSAGGIGNTIRSYEACRDTEREATLRRVLAIRFFEEVSEDTLGTYFDEAVVSGLRRCAEGGPYSKSQA